MGLSNPSRSKGKRPPLRIKSLPAATTDFLITLTLKDDMPSLRKNDLRSQALLACWRELASLRPGLRPDAALTSPGHFQGILRISTQVPEAPLLPEAVKLFKVLTALRVSQLAKTKTENRDRPGIESAATVRAPRQTLWKQGYSEKMISGTRELREARKALGL